MIKLLKQFSVLILFMLIAGCYTMINHPKILQSDMTEEEFSSDEMPHEISHFENCAQCHSNGINEFTTSYTEENYVIPTDSYTYQNWQYFYDQPWWTGQQNYVSRAAGTPVSKSLPPTQKRNVFSRSSSTFPSATSSAISVSGASGSLSKKTSSQDVQTTKSKSTSNESESSNKRTDSTRKASTNNKTKKRR